MKISRVFLIKPAYKDSYYAFNDLPAGLGYISQALDDNNIDNMVFDMYLSKKVEDLFNAIELYKPELIGLSLMSYRFLEHYKLMDNIKDKFPTIPIVVGGPHLSTYREEVLKDCKSVDFGVVLEGDETIIELCNNINDPSLIPGLIYRGKKEITYNGDRPYIKDIDNVTWPKYKRFDIEKYNFITVVTSRGCPYKCTYCPVLYTIGTKYRYRNANSVVDELEYWYKSGMKTFEFGDDNFTLKRTRVYEICNKMKERNLTGIKIGLGNGIRADRVDHDMLSLMKSVGFSYVAFGVEGGNNKVLKALRKGEKMEEIEAGIKAACDVGLPVQLFFLLGSITETEEDVIDAVKFATKYPVIDIRFYNILPFPTTELYNQILDGYKGAKFIRDPLTHLNDSSHWFFNPVFETPELSEKDRIRLLKWANKTTQKHTNKVRINQYVEKFVAAGLPHFIAIILVNIWFKRDPHSNKTPLLKKIVKKFGLYHKIKAALLPASAVTAFHPANIEHESYQLSPTGGNASQLSPISPDLSIPEIGENASQLSPMVGKTSYRLSPKDENDDTYKSTSNIRADKKVNGEWDESLTDSDVLVDMNSVLDSMKNFRP